MKIQELAIIFIIIILPISLLLSEYTQFQIQTIKMQTEYDARLTSATYDAIMAFQLNATNSTTSDLSNSKMRDLEASIKTFRNSIMTGFELNGYTEEDLNNYIPALVYTLYDGFYIYSPYENTHDKSGNRISGNLEAIYGLKPYINYSCRYKTDDGKIDVVITYALDNYITVQGQIGDDYVNKSGYLIDGITISGDTVKYNDIEIQKEQLKESLLGRECNYAKINGTKYYLIENYTDDGKDCIVYILNGKLIVQYEEGDAKYLYWKDKILNNDSAKQYYKEAYEFTEWLREETDLDTLTYANAIDEVITKDGDISITNVWAGDNTLIFEYNPEKNIENELSNYNQHRLAVIRHKIETNLAIAIANYNNYSGAFGNVFQMPELKENEWDNITHNISLISFLQGLHIGGKVYNGYTLVTNSESKEVVIEDNIYILGQDIEGKKTYHKIGDKGFENGTLSINSGEYGEPRSAGRLNLDFERRVLKNNNVSYYYYPLEKYNASYNSIVMQNNVTTYDDIYEYVNIQSYGLKEAFYTALGRERVGKYNSQFNNNDATEKNIVTDGLIRHYDAANNTGNGHDSFARTWKDLSGHYNATINGATFSDNYLYFDGTDDGVNAGYLGDLDYVTLNVKFSLNGSYPDGVLANDVLTTGTAYLGILIDEEGYPAFQWKLEGAIFERLTSTELLEYNRVYDITGTFDGTQVKLFVDGACVGVKSVSGMLDLSAMPYFSMGVFPYSDGSLDYKGNYSIYSVKVWNRALTEEEIQQNLAASNITTAPTTPIIAAKLADGSTYTGGTWTNQSVTLTAFATDDESRISYYQYSTDGTNWNNMTNGTVTFTDTMNSTVYVRAVDAVGNVSANASIVVKIDKIYPKAKITTSANLVNGMYYTNKPSITIYASEMADTGGSGFKTLSHLNGWYGTTYIKYCTPGIVNYDSTNNRYYATFNFSEIRDTTTWGKTNNGEGYYTFDSHIHDNAGNGGGYGAKNVIYDTTGPTHAGMEIKNVSSTGYDVYIYGVSDNLSGINRIQVPTWTNANGQDDLAWANGKAWQTGSAYSATNLGDGTWYYRVNVSDHNYEEGMYISDVYVYDNAGNIANWRPRGTTYID